MAQEMLEEGRVDDIKCMNESINTLSIYEEKFRCCQAQSTTVPYDHPSPNIDIQYKIYKCVPSGEDKVAEWPRI